jgi:hypothetical protein
MRSRTHTHTHEVCVYLFYEDERDYNNNEKRRKTLKAESSIKLAKRSEKEEGKLMDATARERASASCAGVFVRLITLPCFLSRLSFFFFFSYEYLFGKSVRNSLF